MRRMKNTNWASFLLGLGLLHGAGCAQTDSQPGTVIVDWEITIGCSVSGVETVEARLIDKESHLTNLSYDSSVASCSAEEPIIFASVPPGKYELILEGFDAEGAGTYLSEASAFKLGAGATVEVPRLALTQKRGAIDVKWVFGNGELCAANQVTQIQLSLLDETSSQLFEEELEQAFPCDPYTLDEEQRTVGANPNPDLELSGVLLGDLIAGSHYVYAYGLNEAGEKVTKGMVHVSVELGKTHPEKLVLVDCESSTYPEVFCD